MHNNSNDQTNPKIFDWYIPQLIKDSFSDITIDEYNSKKANAIIIVQSEKGLRIRR